MNDYKDLLVLLRAGVDSSKAGDSCFKIQDSSFKSDIDFEKIEELALKQNVLPLVFDGLRLYYEKCGLDAPVEVKLQWYGAAQQAEKHYNEHLTAIRTLTEYLAGKNLRAMVLKGYGLSRCYPKPSHRPCGDIDIYCFGDYKKVDELVSRVPFCKVDKTHHHHTVFLWNGISVENHYDFVNIYSHTTDRKLEPYLKKLAMSEEPLVEDGILIPSPNLTALFTFVHNASDFSGIVLPLRKVVDWYLLRKKYDEQVDWQMIEGVLKELGFDKFFKAWNKITYYVMEGKGELDETETKILKEILHPRVEDNYPENKVLLALFKLRRWWLSRWKMKLVYTKENLFTGFFIHLYSHWLKPEKLIE